LKNNPPCVGIALIAVSAASFGAMAILARSAYASGANVVGILWLRFLLAGPILFVATLATGHRFPRRRQLAVAAAMGGIGCLGQAMAYFSALEHASAGLVALLLYLYPVVTIVLAAGFLGEDVLPLQIAGGAMILAAAGLVVR
jgi:drug/metabolite transporter (DMT)-like permease